MITVWLERWARGANSRPRRLGARKPTWTRWSLAALASLLTVPGGVARGDAVASRHGVVLSVSVSSAKGRVLCGLYERNGWLKRPVKGSVASIRSNTATCQFADVKAGTYAVGAFQDENSNGRLDRSWTGFPREPWCLSRGPRGTLGPPSFDAASFPVTQGTVHMSCRAR